MYLEEFKCCVIFSENLFCVGFVFYIKKNITKFRSSDPLTDVELYFILMGQTCCEQGHIGAIKTSFML